MSLLISCAGRKAEPAVVIDKEQIKKEIQAKEDEFAAIYNGGEVKDIGYYADDATTFFQNTPAIVGKQAIVDFLKSDLVNNSNKISFKTNEVFVSGDANQVLEVGYFTVVDSTNTPISSPTNPPPPPMAAASARKITITCRVVAPTAFINPISAVRS